MTHEALLEHIGSWTNTLEVETEGVSLPTVKVDLAELHNFMKRLRDDEATRMDYLFCVTGVDWDPELGVVYHMESTTHRHTLVVKASTEEREKPVFPTVSDLWITADFHEREIHDLLGIYFEGHPNMAPLILTEQWEGYPLRKDYVDEVNMVIK